MIYRLITKIKNISESKKSAIAYTFSTMFSRGLAIITVPIFTRLMTSSDIGVVNLYNSWYSILSVVATLSLTSGGFAIAMKEYENKRDQYQSSVLTLTSLIAAGMGIAYFCASNFWERIIGLPKSLILLMILGFLFAPARDFWLARQRYEYKYKSSCTVIILSAIVASVASVVVVMFYNAKNPSCVAEGRLFANYIVLYSVAGIIWLFTFFRGREFINTEYWKYSLSLSIPLVGYSIAAQILNVSDRVMIGKMVGNSAVGIYGTLHAVSSLSLLVWQAINASFIPYLFQNINKDVEGIKKSSYQLLVMYAGAAIVFVYLAPEIVQILATKEYYEAIYIMPPIAAGIFYTSLSNMYSNLAIYYKKTQYVMYPAVIAAIVNIVLNYVFIGMFGYIAAAYTTLVSYILLAFFQYKWARRLCLENNIPEGKIYDDRKIMVLSIVTTCLSLLGIPLYSYPIIRYIAIIVGLVIVLNIVLKRIKK